MVSLFNRNASGKGMKNSPDNRNLRTGKGKIPYKREINFAAVTAKKSLNLYAAIPGVILILAAACLISKLLVVDRLVEINTLDAEIVSLENQLNIYRDKIEEYQGELEDYSHYTYAGLKDTERNRVDRMKAIRLLEKVVYPKAAVKAWSFSDTVMTLQLTGNSLGEINQIIQELQAEDIVEFCTVTTAATTPLKEELAAGVTAQISIYLIPTEITGKGVTP